MPIKIFPVVQMLFFGLLMLPVRELWSFAAYDYDARHVLTVIIAACGMLLIVAGGAMFRRYNTTVNPHTPDATNSLVISGVYRYSRNPMYLGFVLILCAWCIYLGNLLNLLIVPLYILTLTLLNIRPEERILENKFGPHYIAYRQQVRRWL